MSLNNIKSTLRENLETTKIVGAKILNENRISKSSKEREEIKYRNQISEF
jgi:hypothetical protein